MLLEKGVIVGVYGSYGSGIATMIFEDNEVFCENGPTIRALEECFGNVIGEGHTINNENGGHVGQEIVYSVDFMGILEGFDIYDPEKHDKYLGVENYETM
jgi:hypothetical protein